MGVFEIKQTPRKRRAWRGWAESGLDDAVFDVVTQNQEERNWRNHEPETDLHKWQVTLMVVPEVVKGDIQADQVNEEYGSVIGVFHDRYKLWGFW